MDGNKLEKYIIVLYISLILTAFVHLILLSITITNDVVFLQPNKTVANKNTSTVRRCRLYGAHFILVSKQEEEYSRVCHRKI